MKSASSDLERNGCAGGFPPDAAGTLDTHLSGFLAAGLAPGDRLCVGFSGGMDSAVLLHALSRLASSGTSAFSLSALHVHHGISPNADAWAERCAAFCRECGVPLDIVRVQVPRDSGEGLEAAARRLRHAVFSGLSADWLALAHHRDDQAETVLLNLLRGAGVAGAAGMLAERPQARGPTLVRPLLDLPRAVIEAYAAKHGMRWIEDESNEDRRFRRNFLRHEIMPRLAEKFPGAGRSLARSAGHFAEAAGLLDDLAAIDRAALALPSGRIGLAGFIALPLARARNLLRHAWRSAGFRAPDARWIDEAIRQLACVTPLSETCVSTPDGELHAYRGELHIVAHFPAPPSEPLRWAGEEMLPWAGGRVRFAPSAGEGIQRSLLDGARVELMSRQGGEHLQPHVKRPRRSLRNLLRENTVPPWERGRLPYLWCNGRLAWVGGLGVDSGFACPPGEAGMLPVWEPA